MLDVFDRTTLETSDARWTYACVARFQDVDAAGFLFFARMYDYFHDAWHAFMEARGMSPVQTLREREWGAPLRRTAAEFLSPIRFGDKIEIALVRAAWKDSAVTIGFRASVEGRVAALGTHQHVVLSMATMTRIEPSPRLREAFKILE